MKYVWNGEVKKTTSHRDEVDEDMDDQLVDMVCDIKEDSFKRVHVYDTLQSDKEGPLYLGFKIFT